MADDQPPNSTPSIQPKDYFKNPPGKQSRLKSKPEPPSAARWIFKIAGMTFAISAMLALVSGTVIPALHVVFAILILLMFIALGVFFDILGLSVAIVNEKPFHSMAANRVPGAGQSLLLIKNAEKVSSFCNDVVGDICGIISGATASVIVSRVVADPSAPNLIVQVLFSALVSALTVTGKALGKTVSLNHNVAIVKQMGLWIFRWKRLLRQLGIGKKSKK